MPRKVKRTIDHKYPTLKFSRSEIVCGIGMVLFAVSLYLPAIKHGKVTTGEECFGISLLVMFSSASSGRSFELPLMALVSHQLHLLACIAIIRVANSKTKPVEWTLFATINAICSVAYLVTVPYSGIERTFFGYYLWLISLLTIFGSDCLNVWSRQETR